ncbi:uncharacterized protein LOC134147503 [Rhea pennata]|uniref:uncharacterized protein LOC134147503 n=1 Tax=Rhea pennata TaxID=8795 RepID=UPI002E2522C5
MAPAFQYRYLHPSTDTCLLLWHLPPSNRYLQHVTSTCTLAWGPASQDVISILAPASQYGAGSPVQLPASRYGYLHPGVGTCIPAWAPTLWPALGWPWPLAAAWVPPRALRPLALQPVPRLPPLRRAPRSRAPRSAPRSTGCTPARPSSAPGPPGLPAAVRGLPACRGAEQAPEKPWEKPFSWLRPRFWCPAPAAEPAETEIAEGRAAAWEREQRGEAARPRKLRKQQQRAVLLPRRRRTQHAARRCVKIYFVIDKRALGAGSALHSRALPGQALAGAWLAEQHPAGSDTERGKQTHGERGLSHATSHPPAARADASRGLMGGLAPAQEGATRLATTGDSAATSTFPWAQLTAPARSTTPGLTPQEAAGYNQDFSNPSLALGHKKGINR